MRSIAMLSLIIASSCAGHPKAPDAPPITRCQNLKDHFRCRAPDGKKFSDPYPGKEPLVCVPAADWEARKNWESTLR